MQRYIRTHFTNDTVLTNIAGHVGSQIFLVIRCTPVTSGERRAIRNMLHKTKVRKDLVYPLSCGNPDSLGGLPYIRE